MKKDDLESGYSLNDFGLTFNEKSNKNMALRSPHYSDDINLAKNNNADSTKNDNIDSAHDYAPQFQGFSDELLQNEESNKKKDDKSDFFYSEKDLILTPHISKKQSEVSTIFIAYAILFLMLLVFMPQVYLANNIYYASKNINYLKSQKEALRDENGDLQKQLESLKFNFLTLEIEEIH